MREEKSVEVAGSPEGRRGNVSPGQMSFMYPIGAAARIPLSLYCAVWTCFAIPNAHIHISRLHSAEPTDRAAAYSSRVTHGACDARCVETQRPSSPIWTSTHSARRNASLHMIIRVLPALPGPHFGRRALFTADVLMGGKIVYIYFSCSLDGGYFF